MLCHGERFAVRMDSVKRPQIAHNRMILIYSRAVRDRPLVSDGLVRVSLFLRCAARQTSP
jgi:hypothetical protein